MKDGVRIAVFGTGAIAQLTHIPVLAKQKGAALVALCDNDGAKARALADRFDVPDVYTDLRILLGWAWTYLIVAEVIGVSSGITFFINQQAKYRNFENVYAAIIIIGR